MKLENGEILEYLEDLKPKIDKIVAKYLPRRVSKKWLREVFGKPRYLFPERAVQEAILQPIWDFFDRGGKRWRAALFLSILEALRGNVKRFEDFSIIPEILHNSSLIVDDIEDQGELRRGKPALHKIYGLDIALNVGNFFYFFPFYIFKKQRKKLKGEIYLRLLEAYLKGMGNLHLGQGTDIFWHKGLQEEILEREYFQMAAFKTGCVARLAGELAAILAEKENLIDKIGKFCESLGVAFQIQDDILDIALTGRERKKFGKSFGNDIKEGKRSLMVIYTLKKAKEEDKRRLIEILNKHTGNVKEIKEAIEIIKKYGAIEYAKEIAKKIIKESWLKIERFLLESKAKKRLKEFYNYLIERKV